jgi:hypothetical protein
MFLLSVERCILENGYVGNLMWAEHEVVSDNYSNDVTPEVTASKICKMRAKR